MVDGFEIQVPITIKGGKEGDRVGSQIGEKVAKQIEKAFRSIGLSRGISTGGGKIGGETLAMAGMAKNVAGMATKLSIIAVVAGSLLGIASRASPYLKGILSIFGRAFMIFFRPFGDFLATLLRPLAIMLMKMAVAFLKWTRSPTGEAIKDVAEESITGAGGLLGGFPILGLSGGLNKLLSPLYEQLKKFPGWLWEKITSIWNWTKDFPGWLWGKITGIWSWSYDLAGWLWEKIKGIWSWSYDLAGWLWGKITTSFNNLYSILSGFATWMWNNITNPLKNIYSWLSEIGQWLFNKITGAFENIGNLLSRVGIFLYERITESIKSAFSGFKFAWSWMWSKGGGQVGIPNVPSDGLYKLHKGEEVVPKTKVGGGSSIIFRPVFQISNAGVSKDIDVDAIVRRAGRITEMELKKRGII